MDETQNKIRLKAVWYLPNEHKGKRRTTIPKSLRQIKEEGLVGQIARLDANNNFQGFVKINKTNLDQIRGTPEGSLLWLSRQPLHVRMSACSTKPSEFYEPFQMPDRSPSEEAGLIAEVKASIRHYGYIVDDPALYEKEGRIGPRRTHRRCT